MALGIKAKGGEEEREKKEPLFSLFPFPISAGGRERGERGERKEEAL